MKRALITGITGQDGSYLADLLLSKPDYEVHGLVRRSSSLNRQRIDHLFSADPSITGRFQLHYADLADASSLAMVMEQIRPDEVYNLGGAEPRPRLVRSAAVHGRRRRPGYVAAARGRAATEPQPTGEVLPGVELGDVRLGAAAAGPRHAIPSPQPVRVCQALRPLADDQLPRGVWPVRVLGHPVQPREPPAGRVVRHPQGDAWSRADQGGPAEEARHGQPGGQARLGIRRRLCRGDVVNAPAGDSPTTTSSPPARPTPCASSSRWRSPHSTSTTAISSSSITKYTRPSEVDVLLGDATKARKVLGWKPKVDFPGLVKMMIESDLELARRERYVSTYSHK